MDNVTDQVRLYDIQNVSIVISYVGGNDIADADSELMGDKFDQLFVQIRNRNPDYTVLYANEKTAQLLISILCCFCYVKNMVLKLRKWRSIFVIQMVTPFRSTTRMIRSTYPDLECEDSWTQLNRHADQYLYWTITITVRLEELVLLVSKMPRVKVHRMTSSVRTSAWIGKGHHKEIRKINGAINGEISHQEEPKPQVYQI